jgi:hypothetical protein
MQKDKGAGKGTTETNLTGAGASVTTYIKPLGERSV